MMTKWFLVMVALVLNAAANILLKIGAKSARPLPEDSAFLESTLSFLNGPTVLGISLFAVNVLVYRKALEGLNVSIAYPVMASGALVLVTLGAACLPALREKVSITQIVGILLIGAGIWLVAHQLLGQDHGFSVEDPCS